MTGAGYLDSVSESETAGGEAGLAARGLHLLGPGHRVELDSAVAAGGDQGVRVGEAPVHAVHPGHVDTHTTQRPRAARAGLVTSTPGVPELDISLVSRGQELSVT